MTFLRARARILEISTTSGGGPLALSGAADGSFNTFSSFMSVGDTTHVTVVEPGAAFWSGIATYSVANQITLTAVEETKGTFGIGTKEVMATPLASLSALPFDITGAIVATGSGSYNVASHRGYTTLAQLDGNIVAFTPNFTNVVGQQLIVDGLGAKPIRLVPGEDIAPGVLIQGTPYLVLYNHTDGAYYPHGLSGMSHNPYGVPLGAGMDYWLPTTPSSAFAFPAGQAISRTTYANLFAAMGTIYGAGDGSTTFNLPDKTGRVSAMKEATATRLTAALAGGVDGGSLGAVGGLKDHTLTASQIPSITSANASQAISVGTGGPVIPGTDPGNPWLNLGAPATGGFTSVYRNGVSPSLNNIASMSGANSISVTSNNTGGNAHNNVQPTIVCNYIMRVL
ncbi:tail fiber protein [Bradyrhizobium sp. LA7.1]|uniref:phage tail protein n=1 Tax=Bradyrhizobium sp. LA7.1 TaxID=3156324 RepID=UPI003398FED3